MMTNEQTKRTWTAEDAEYLARVLAAHAVGPGGRIELTAGRTVHAGQMVVLDESSRVRPAGGA